MQRCSNAAYAVCQARHMCGPIEEAVFAENSACAIFNATVNGTIDQLLAKPGMLRPGDSCPFCGQPIKTTDPALLSILTLLRDELEMQSKLELEVDNGTTISGD